MSVENKRFSLFKRGRSGDYKNKISAALRDIDAQRRELEALKVRLAERRKKLFDVTVRALQEKNKSKAAVYANEHAEVRKVVRVVEASELALTQVALRLQSITEIGDAMVHMDAAFRSLKQISHTMQGFMPALDAASTDINSTLVETMAQMGQISPDVNINIKTDNAEELVEQARKYAEEQSEQLRASLQVAPAKLRQELTTAGGAGGEDNIPILATGEEGEESPILGTLYASPKDDRVENELLRYASTHAGVLDISETSNNLGLPQDLVEQSMIHLVAQGKVRADARGEQSR